MCINTKLFFCNQPSNSEWIAFYVLRLASAIHFLLEEQDDYRSRPNAHKNTRSTSFIWFKHADRFFCPSKIAKYSAGGFEFSLGGLYCRHQLQKKEKP